MKKLLIPVFPGTNCEVETRDWANDNLEVSAEFLELGKHESLKKEDVAGVIVPGGFSYGDYLRAGAIAARSKEMKFIGFLASQSVPVIGICNGFQILCEAGLLPGVLTFNQTKQHHHFPVELTLNMDFALASTSPWLPKVTPTRKARLEKMYSEFRLPMSCGMGNYLPADRNVAEADFMKKHVPLRYLKNENGSWASVAAVAHGSVLGMMPHPERASETIVGSTKGLLFLFGLAENAQLKIRKGSALETFAADFECVKG